jgi:4-amino-4-deoxy-L-arabinose transferase-like glycosyltransferase
VKCAWTEKNGQILILILLWLAVTGLFVRIWGLREYAFSPDDVMHLWIANGETLSEVWQSSVDRQTNPPLIYIVLHYMLKISRNEFFLRSVSLVPGVGLIFAFYLLGRRVSGMVAGIAMAYMAAFGYGAILLSQVIRAYSMLLFFLTLALWFFFSYWETDRKNHLCGYLFCILLAISFHYSAIIACAAIGTVWLAGIMIRKKPLKEYGWLLLCYLPIIILLGSYYYFHVSEVLSSTFYRGMKETYLEPQFPNTLSLFAENIDHLFDYLFLPRNAVWTLVLALAGFVVLWKQSRCALAVIILLTFSINFLLTFLDAYPFGGARQSIYLFPLVSVLIGTTLQSAFTFFKDGIASMQASGRLQDRQDLKRIGPIITVCLLLSTAPVMAAFSTSNFLRTTTRAHGASVREFPVERAAYRRIMDHLNENAGPADIVLTNTQTSNYFLWLSGQRSLDSFSDRLGTVEHHGIDIFVVGSWHFDSTELLYQAFYDLNRSVDMTRVPRVWLINIGWGASSCDVLPPDLVCGDFIRENISLRGASLCSIEGKIVHENLANTVSDTGFPFEEKFPVMGSPPHNGREHFLPKSGELKLGDLTLSEYLWCI